jgi:hypothetical protein
MHAEHPITTLSRRWQAQPCVACSPCTCFSLGGGRRWRRPRSPCRCSSVSCARRWRRPRSPCSRPYVGCAGRWRRPRTLHSLLRRLCSQMEAPPQSLQMLLTRLCCLALALVLNGLAFWRTCLTRWPSALASPVTNATGTSRGLMRWSRVDSDIPARSGQAVHKAPRGLSCLSGARSHRRGSADDG